VVNLLWQTAVELWLGFTRAAAALADSAPWDKKEAAAASAVAGPMASVAASRPTAALVRRPLGEIPVGDSAVGTALGQDKVVVYIPGGLSHAVAGQ
jgi:hypothetical protein